MLNFRSGAPKSHTYSVEEAAEFMEYDRKTVEYWLRMGHLSGQWDRHTAAWRIRPGDIIAFLQQSDEPMPTGASWRSQAAPEQTTAPVSRAMVGVADELTH